MEELKEKGRGTEQKVFGEERNRVNVPGVRKAKPPRIWAFQNVADLGELFSTVWAGEVYCPSRVGKKVQESCFDRPGKAPKQDVGGDLGWCQVIVETAGPQVAGNPEPVSLTSNVLDC